MTRRFCFLITLLILFVMIPAWGQLRLPAQDGRGELLAREPTAEIALGHQQTIIYLLLVILVISILVNIWVTAGFLRMQYTIERVVEAVRRVDLLSQAFHSVSVEWDMMMKQKQRETPPPGDVDLEDDWQPSLHRCDGRWKSPR
jgi:hypothetical protein